MLKKKLAVPMTALALVLSAGGGLVAAAHADTIASSTQAVSSSSVSSSSSTDAQAPAFDPAKGGHVGKNGTKEVLLTGDQAARATAAALAAVPGATIQRAETDAEGAAYEAHVTKSDGSEVTVKFDSNFNVTSTEAGGHGGHGHQGGQPDNDADDVAPSSSTASS